MSKPKLLIIPSWYPHPGDEINGSFFQEQARLLSAKYDTRVLYIKFSARPPAKLFSVSPFRWLKYVLFGLAKIDLPAKEVYLEPPLSAWQARTIGLSKGSKVEKRLDFYVRAVKAMREEGWSPDLVHAHSVYCGGLAAEKLKATFSVPYLITEHSPFSLKQYPRKVRKMVRRCFENADLVLSLSNDKVRQVCMSGIDIDSNLVFNFADEKKFDLVCSPYVTGNSLKLVSIGAASHYKDHKTLLRSLLELKKRGVPFELTLLGLKVWGGNDLYHEIIQTIAEYGLEELVTVVDKVERSEVNARLAAHNVFVMTSVAEGFPVSVLEAWVTGLFVVSTRHGGTEDVLNERIGALTDVKNHLQVANYLEDIYLGNIKFDPEKIRAYVISICGTDAFAARLDGYYRKVLSAPEHVV